MNATLVLSEMSPNLDHHFKHKPKFYSLSSCQAIKPPDQTVCSPNFTLIVTLPLCLLGWQVKLNKDLLFLGIT